MSHLLIFLGSVIFLSAEQAASNWNSGGLAD
jgi:hypothetical protein